MTTANSARKRAGIPAAVWRVAALWLPCCAALAGPQSGQPGGPEAAEDGPPPLLDRTQQTVETVVNSTSRWFDSFFGTPTLNRDLDEEDQEVTRGLLAVAGTWDERDEFDPDVRLRAQIPLPRLKRRTRLLLGRGATEDLVDGTEVETFTTLPNQFQDLSDDDWLLGLGYRGYRVGRSGWDFSLGASISSANLNPYTRVTYQWRRLYGDSAFWRLQPRLYWQNDRGVGASVNSILDYVATPSWLLRSWITLVGDERVEGMGWNADFLAYQSINDDAAFKYRLFLTGETGAAVALQDYGFEVRWRQRVLREWFYVELFTGLSWPRELPEEDRETNFGIGIGVEMQFGDWPGREQKNPSRGSGGPDASDAGVRNPC